MRNLTSRFLCGLAVAASLTTAALAQTASTPTIKLTMEDRHVLREGLLKDTRVKPETSQVSLEVGSTVPPAVQLHAFPQIFASKIPQLKAHRFFVASDAIVVVEPTKRAVVEVVK